jgi:hypothetical protein
VFYMVDVCFEIEDFFILNLKWRHLKKHSYVSPRFR